MADPTVTWEQYTAALKALGLDPDTTTSVNLTGGWFNATVADVDKQGRPRLERGQLATRQLSSPIQDAEPSA